MESELNMDCFICKEEKSLVMLSRVDEIPYFGEHTQVTVKCNSCGWRQTDFIPAEGKKSGLCSIVIDNAEFLSTRVVRSSSCTIKIPELDLPDVIRKDDVLISIWNCNSPNYLDWYPVT